MGDLLDQALTGRNWIERIADRLPGFSGYQKRETRREIDRVWRGYLGRKIDTAREALGGIVRELSHSGNLDALSGFDGVEKGLDGLANRIRSADSGYAGFFDAVKVDERELEAVYRFDLAFDDVATELAHLIEAAASPGGPDAATLRRAVEQAQAQWKQRADLLDLAASPRG